MHAALASKFAIATSLARVAPNRVAERAPRTAGIECAHKKGTGSTKNGRDSNPKYLGVKKYGEEKVQVGSIIVRQRGNTFHAGEGVGTGKDFTLYALREGEVKFKVGAKKKKFVTVVDAVDRRGREDGQPTRKDTRRAMYTPRAAVREALANGTEAPARAVEATTASSSSESAAPKRQFSRSTTKGFYRQISSVKYCNFSLLILDEAMEKNGVVSRDDAAEFYEHMLDGPGVTATELRTLEFVLNGGGGKYEYNVAEDAKAFLTETIAAEKAKADADAGARCAPRSTSSRREREPFSVPFSPFAASSSRARAFCFSLTHTLTIHSSMHASRPSLDRALRLGSTVIFLCTVSTPIDFESNLTPHTPASLSPPRGR